MTVSTHIYTATVGALPLNIKGGSITLDASAAIHVTADITITRPDAETYDALFPLQSPVPRVVIEVDATLPSSTQARTFDLHVRSRVPDEETGDVVLSLASDEGLLLDYALLGTDNAPLDEAPTAQALANYVLEQVIGTGTEVDAGDPDADIFPIFDLENLQPNPGGELLEGGWTPAVNCTVFSPLGGAYRGARCIGVSSVAAGDIALYPVPLDKRQRATPGKKYVFRFAFKSSYGLGGGRSVWCALRFFDSQGNFAAPDVVGAAEVPVTTDWMTIEDGTGGPWVAGVAPWNAESVMPIVFISGSTAGGQNYFIDDAGLYEMPIEAITELAYFDGAFTDTSTYEYEWSNDAYLSTSRRLSLTPRDPDSLVWKVGDSAMEFVRPVLQSAGLRLVCDEERNWSLRDASYVESGALAIEYAVNMTAGSESTSRDDGSWADAVSVVWEWVDENRQNRRMVDGAWLSPDFTLTRVIRKEGQPFPGYGFADYVLARIQGFGRRFGGASVADWTAKTDMPVTLTGSDGVAREALTQRVTFNLDDDTMVVTTRDYELP